MILRGLTCVGEVTQDLSPRHRRVHGSHDGGEDAEIPARAPVIRDESAQPMVDPRSDWAGTPPGQVERSRRKSNRLSAPFRHAARSLCAACIVNRGFHAVERGSPALGDNLPSGRVGRVDPLTFPRSTSLRGAQMRFRIVGRPLLLLACLFVTLGADATAARKPLVVDLGTLGGTQSQAIGVTASGQVIGNSTTSGDATTHAFLWTKSGGMTDLGTLGGTPSYDASLAEAMNARGHVAGYSITRNGEQHAFLWTKRRGMIDLGTLGGTYSFAKAVSLHGHVAGFSGTAAGEPHAFLWTQSDGMIDLGTLGGTFSIALGVTAQGQVIGNSTIAGDATTHGFSWSEWGGMIDLGTLGGTSTYPAAVNARGQVVGESSTASDIASHAFLWTTSSGMIDLGTLGGNYSSATAVSSRGHVVGASFTSGDAEAHGFSWTQSGGMIDLGADSFPTAVSSRGQIVGLLCVDCGPFPVAHAFWWTQSCGTIDLGTLGGTASFAQAVNARGQVVGRSQITGNAAEHAVLWHVDPGNCEDKEAPDGEDR